MVASVIVLEIILTVLAAWLLADFLTGVIHWLEDRYGTPDWPLLGELVIVPNRLHHLVPLAFTRNSFLSRNSTGMAAALAIGAVVALIIGPSWFLALLVLFGGMANEVHFWAHRPDRAPRLVALLQRAGLVQSRDHHAVHHAPPHLTRYCVLTDWLNPVLDRFGFWRLLERLLPARWQA